MIELVNKIDPKHITTMTVFTYIDSKGKIKTNSKNDHAIQTLAELEKSKTHAATKQDILVIRRWNTGNVENLIFAGLGKAADLTEEDFRRALGGLYRKLESEKMNQSFICKDSLQKLFSKEEVTGNLVAEAIELAGYFYNDLKSKPKELPSLQVVGSKAFATGFKQGQILADAANFARNLGDTPANLLTPTIFAKRASDKAKGTKLKVAIWDEARIKKENFGLMLGVAAGSDQPPRVIYMEYNGGAKSQKPIAYIGKGLTFDCGGISIKPAAGMEEMKYDMCGGANVFATMLAIAKLGLKVNCFAMIGCTENLVNGSATKPGDVHTSRNGKTVEISNTDAEGRLVLADLLSYASDKKPAAIIDAATLTGAMVVALGDLHTGFYTSNDKLAKKVYDAADSSGELVWRMPVLQEHMGDMKGTYSDLNNMGSPARKAGSAQAAGFLKEFVPEEIPYAHFDIAGTAWQIGNRVNYVRNGASGCMVRTFVQIAKNWK
jgi:leucyl aminopeptidase